MNTHVITVAKKFPKGHDREGQLTGFKTKILTREKIHTIRLNFLWWQHKVQQVADGLAVLSLREWTGKPYHSPQEEFARLDQHDFVGIERVTTNHMGKCFVDGQKIDGLELAANDGLLFTDFSQWFPGSFEIGTKKLDAGIIHFTSFRYAPGPKMDFAKADSRKKPGNIVVGCGPADGIPFEGQTT